MEEFIVYARDGSRIPAYTGQHPSPESIALARRAFQLELASAKLLQPPTGRYNCHGLVFASRRAQIAETDMDDLLRRDGYVPLQSGQTPQVGDVVVYRDEVGEIEHTGFVSRLEPIGTVPVAFIWSAWGALGEYEHRAHVCPYKGRPEYWRMR